MTDPSPTEMGWRPIETAPKEGEFLALVEVDRERVMQVRRMSGISKGDLRVVEPWTGKIYASWWWMPVPAPPEQTDAR